MWQQLAVGLMSVVGLVSVVLPRLRLAFPDVLPRGAGLAKELKQFKQKISSMKNISLRSSCEENEIMGTVVTNTFSSSYFFQRSTGVSWKVQLFVLGHQEGKLSQSRLCRGPPQNRRTPTPPFLFQRGVNSLHDTGSISEHRNTR